jgi:phosphohistidine phosphatase
MTNPADDVSTLLVVGHGPMIPDVAVVPAGADGTDTVAVERISAKYPTSAITVLRIDGRWDNSNRTGAWACWSAHGAT